MKRLPYERYKIKGKIYYKLEEKEVPSSDSTIISARWIIMNSKGEKFTLFFRESKRCKYYSVYNKNAVLVFKTRSISRVED